MKQVFFLKQGEGYVHNVECFFQSTFFPIPYLGATSLAVNAMPGHATSYEISKKIRVLQDREEMSCDPENSQKLSKCLQDYFDKNLHCALPWRPNIKGGEFGD
jgi:hypothetical protein